MKKTLLFITALLFCTITFAQEGKILYFDLEPDSTRTFRNWETPDPPIRIDLDRDGLCEWKFESENAGHQSIDLSFCPNIANSHPAVDTLGYYTRLRVVYACQSGDTTVSFEWGNVSGFEIRELGDYPNQMIALRYKV